MSKFAFQVLYWLTDEALFAKDLCTIGSLIDDVEITSEIKHILREVQVFAEKAKTSYNEIIHSEQDVELKTIYEFMLPLFNRCYKSHSQLKALEVRIVDHLKNADVAHNIVHAS